MNAHVRFNSGALIVGPYRYWLKRRLSTGRRLIVWVMLNPSTADHKKNDATIRRVMRFSKDWGFNIVIVVNVFAYRATKPKVMFAHLKKHGDMRTIGPDNSFWVNYWMDRADRVVIGWGNNFLADPEDIFRTFPDAFCLGLTKSLQPRHPLMVAANHRSRLYAEDHSDALAQADRMRPVKPIRHRRNAHKA